MIKIFSQANDYSTNNTIDWLDYYGADFERYNQRENYLSENIPFAISIEPAKKKYTSIWFRRPILTNNSSKFIDNQILNEPNKYEEILLYLKKIYEIELKQISAFDILNIHSDTKVLGTFDKHDVNKHTILREASSVGFEIPKSIFTNNKNSLQVFFNSCLNGIISKLNNGTVIDFDNNQRKMAFYTEEINQEFIETLPGIFHPSFFQEKLDKSYEIRTFYLAGECFSMAMFSQQHEQTSVDFKRYNREKMVRRVPYKLPIKIEEIIDKLMKKIDINTGSLDIVRTKNGRYVFLEVNPVGQYDMLNKPCNYFLDKKIAEFLIKT